MSGQQVILKNSPQEIQSLDLCRLQPLTVVSDSKAKRSSLLTAVVSRVRTDVFRITTFIREDSARADQAEKFLNEARAKGLSYHHRTY